MHIDLTPKQEAHLAEVAVLEGTTAEQLIQVKVMRILHADERFLAAVQQGFEAADRGELIDHEEVLAHMQK